MFCVHVSTQSKCISSCEDSALTHTSTSFIFPGSSQIQWRCSLLASKPLSLNTWGWMWVGSSKLMVYYKTQLQYPSLPWDHTSLGPISGKSRRTTLNAVRRASPTPDSLSWPGAGRGSSHAQMASASGGRHSYIRQRLNQGRVFYKIPQIQVYKVKLLPIPELKCCWQVQKFKCPLCQNSPYL